MAFTTRCCLVCFRATNRVESAENNSCPILRTYRCSCEDIISIFRSSGATVYRYTAMQRIGKVVLLPSITGSKVVEEEEQADSSDDEETLREVPLLDLPSPLRNRLMDHQRIGVRWLHSLFLSGSGGILGDDMGLGKTFQVICLLAGLMQEESIQRVLILAPVSVLPNWQRELMEHLQPHIRECQIMLLNADLTKKKRLQMLDTTFQSSIRGYSPKVVISSYQLVSNMIDEFSNRGKWDYVILDEGHIIKNPSTKTSKSMHQLMARHRLILTGTPIQNNLNEFWAIADWATKGKRFGKLSGFKEDFTTPIVAGQNPKATAEERQIAKIAASNLLTLTKPILLQRKKCELPINGVLKLPTKIELVVWSPLATSQRSLYEEFLQSRQFDMAVHRSTCPVEVINHLKTVCRHPLLIEALEANRRRREAAKTPSQKFSRSQSQQSRDDDDGDADLEGLSAGLARMNVAAPQGAGLESEGDELLDSLPANATVYDVIGREPDVTELLRGSIKLRILLKLIHRLHFAGHRTLVFSQSRLMLDIIRKVLAHHNFATHRIDGAVKSAERQRIIDEFNDTSDGVVGPSICLLTTKACGFGITLTGADRVIIYDPSWNPAEDRQAVDRAYRIGQTKPVVVYRLIMASSVEEKMYEKQVFKDGIRVVTESGSSSRYFSKDETTEMFTLGPVDQSVVMERLWKAAGGEMRSFPDTRGDLPSVLGFSRHDTLYAEVRPDSLSQGEDAYAQFTDPNYAPSDDEEDYVGVSPTPAPARARPHEGSRTTALPRTPLQRGGPGAGKENILSFFNKTPATQGFGTVKGRYSDPVDLLTPPPSAAAARAQPVKSPGVDPETYAALRDAKLYSPDTGSVPASRISSAVSMKSPLRRDSPDRVMTPQEEQSAGPAMMSSPSWEWDAPSDAEYSALREFKLHPGSGQSPLAPSGRMSMPDRVSMLTDPSVYGDECEVNSPQSGDQLAFSCVKSKRTSTGCKETSQDERSRSGTPLLPDESDGDESASEKGSTGDRGAEEVQPVDAECEEDEGERSVGGDAQVDDHQTMASANGVEEKDFLRGGGCDDIHSGGSHRSARGLLLEPEGWSDDDDDEDSAERSVELDCRSLHDRCDDSTEDLAAASGAASIVAAEAVYNDAPESPFAAEACVENEHCKRDDEDVVDVVDHPDSASEAVGVVGDDHNSGEGPADMFGDAVTVVSLAETAHSAGDDASAVPSPGVNMLDSDAGRREVASSRRTTLCSEFYDGSDCDDESGFYLSQPGGGDETRVGSTGVAKSGFLLNNLCEMGSMKRTLSSHSASQEAPAAAGSASLREEAAEAQSGLVANDCDHCDGGDMGAVFMSPSSEAVCSAGEERVRTGGITMRKSRVPRLSNYLEPDLFASPPWMAPSLFSPEQPSRREEWGTQGAFTPSDNRTVATDSCVEVDAERSAIEPPRDSPKDARRDGAVDDLSALATQVRTMSIAVPAVTPVSKISFRGVSGVYSNMIVKAQSVSRAKASFADLSSDSESEEDSDSDDVAGSHLEGSVSGTPCRSGSVALDSAARREALSPEETDSPRTPEECMSAQSPVVHSPGAGPAAATLSSAQSRASESMTPESVCNTQNSPSPCGVLFPDDPDDASQQSDASASSPCAESSPAYERFVLPVLPLCAANALLHPPTSSAAGLACFADMAVPPLESGREPGFLRECTERLRAELKLPELSFPVDLPASALSERQCAVYNEHLSVAAAAEGDGDLLEAGKEYCRAMAICDEDARLHGKLAWILSTLM